MKINSRDYRVPEGETVNLKKWPTSVKPVYKSAKHYKKRLEEHVEQLSALQRLHYASNRYAVLLIFQAMVVNKLLWEVTAFCPVFISMKQPVP